MRRLLAPLLHVIALPGIAARVGGGEFLYRRSDASGDIHPDDAAHGVVEGPDRIAVAGETGMISLGVRTHQIALPAFLARHHATRTGRGVAWSIAPLPGSRLREAAAVIVHAEDDLARADAVVILAGITDVMRVTSVRAWRRQMRVAIDGPRPAHARRDRRPPLHARRPVPGGAHARWRPESDESRYQRTCRSWGAHLSEALAEARA